MEISKVYRGNKLTTHHFVNKPIYKRGVLKHTLYKLISTKRYACDLSIYKKEAHNFWSNTKINT